MPGYDFHPLSGALTHRASANHSWDDFWDRTRSLSSDTEKGRAFERLTQLYLQTAPEYRTKLQHVLLLREVQADIRRRLNLPGPRDEGIDLIARTRRGEYWAIQSKFRSQRDKRLAYWESKKWHQQKPLLPPPKKLTREEEIQLREAYEAKQAERLRIASRISKVDHEQVLDSSARQIVASPQS